jgi:hypothetical protein
MITTGAGTPARLARPRLRVEVDGARVTAWMDALAHSDPSLPAHQILGALARDDERLGTTQRMVLFEHAQHVFGYPELGDPAGRAAVIDGAARLAEGAEPRARRASDLLGGRFYHADCDLTTRLVPGTRLCYGLPGGGQVFGVVPGASIEEACCFLEHTFYHELSGQWASERTAASEREQRTSAMVITWILSLVRNEGVANFYCLDELSRMGRPERWTYFTYAPLIGRVEATLTSLTKLARVLELVTQKGVADATAFVNGTLKNPDLPLINLVGIHLATTIVAIGGDSALAELCHGEPEHFLAAWLESGDPLVDALDRDARTQLAHRAEVRW